MIHVSETEARYSYLGRYRCGCRCVIWHWLCEGQLVISKTRLLLLSVLLPCQEDCEQRETGRVTSNFSTRKMQPNADHFLRYILFSALLFYTVNCWCHSDLETIFSERIQMAC